jgi:hypothetical protein
MKIECKHNCRNDLDAANLGCFGTVIPVAFVGMLKDAAISRSFLHSRFCDLSIA